MNNAHIPGRSEPERATPDVVDDCEDPADSQRAGTSEPNPMNARSSAEVSPSSTQDHIGHNSPSVHSPPQPQGASMSNRLETEVSRKKVNVFEPQTIKEAPRTKIIKRYSNRKLYDTTRSKYVTLDEIARMVREGEDVRIIDNESKEDLTSVTLTQIIYEQEKAARRMPLRILRGIIQTSGDTLNEWFDSMSGPNKAVPPRQGTDIRQSAFSIREAASKQLAELKESARRFFSREERRAEEFQKTAKVHLDQLEAKLTERADQVSATRSALEQHGMMLDDGSATLPSINEVLEQNTSTLKQVEELRTRITALSVLVDRLEHAANGIDTEDFS